MFKMKEEAVTDCRGQKVNSKLVDNSHCIKPTNRTGLRLRENGALVAPASNGVSKDKKYRNKQTEPMKKINAFAKMELDIPEDTALTTKRPSTITSTTTSSRGGTKILGNETYSRVKRSLMGDFPRIHNPAQVHPRPMDGTDIVELRQLRTLVQELRDRETKLQSELMEFKDIREVANRVPILEKELGLRNEEAECLKRNVEDLEGEKCKMAEQLSHYPVLIKEVEEARAKIKEFQRHMLSESRQAEDILQQCINSTENKLKLLEVEVMELRRSNMELQHQKRDLATKLSSAETKVAALGKLTENDIVAKVQAEASKLRHTNENLCKQVEGLQMNRFSEVEELVYLRWVNSCLRYELRNSDVASGRASALDLKDTLSPKSQDIAKQLLLDYASSEQRSQSQRKLCTENDLESLSSYSSSITSEGEEHDETLADQLPSKFNMPKKSSLIGKLKKWTKTNDDWQVVQIDHVSEKGVENSKHQVITSPRRRHSISGPKESIQHLKPQSKQEFAFASKLNSVRASLEASNPKTQMEGLRRSFVTNCSLFEDNSDVGSSFQIISKTVSRDFDDKYPPFKHRHKLMVDQAAVVENAKKVAESGEKPEVAKHCESSISISTDDERSVLRIHKPPPKPSEVAAKNDEVPKLTSISAPAISAPAPPPPPPPPSIPSVKLQGKVNTGAHPPPPPPPPPRFVPASTNTMRRAPQVVEFYQSLMKRDIKKDSSGSGISNTANVSNALSSMIGEIENRSSHLLAIKADVEKQGDFVRSLIGEVKGATYSNIEDVLAFVKWLDDELAFLVDERAVLKHFDWPERKADAMREAAFGYRDLKNLETEISSYECNHHQPCSVALKKMVALLEKCEQKIYNILRTRESSMPRYKEFNIPTDWMLDTGIVSKVKLASVKLAKKYMERVTMELEALKCSEKEPEREFLLLQGVRFAFRVHQFAGGLDAESMQAFEELRNLAHRNHTKS